MTVTRATEADVVEAHARAFAGGAFGTADPSSAESTSVSQIDGHIRFGNGYRANVPRLRRKYEGAIPDVMWDALERASALKRAELGTGDEPFESEEPCALYRYLDAAGRLLYVGISVSPDSRDRQHEKKAAWHRFAASRSVEWFDSIASAHDAEKTAIRSELPIFNRNHATDDRDMRAAHYLVKRNALDLILPAI